MNDLPWGLDFEVDAPGCEAMSEFDHAAQRLSVSVVNRGETPVSPGSVVLTAQVGVPAVSGMVWSPGAATHSPVLAHHFGDEATSATAAFREPIDDGGARYRAAQVLAFSLPARSMPALLVGALRGDQFATHVEADVGADEFDLLALRIIFELETTAIAAGEALDLPPVWIGDGTSVLALIGRYADSAATENAARDAAAFPRIWMPSPPLSNELAGAAAADGGDDFLVVRPTGDAPGLLTEEIRSRGYRPGIAWSPLLLPPDAPAVRETPAMVLTDTAGTQVHVQTADGPRVVLDCSHPGAVAWLAESVAAYAAEFALLRVEGIEEAARSAVDVRYHDAGFTGPKHVRCVLEAIRAAAGDQAVVVADGPFLPAIGLVDAMVVGTDRDGNDASEAGTALHRNFMDGRWWTNAALVLGADGSTVSPGAARGRMHVAVVALSGGVVALSGEPDPQDRERARVATLLDLAPGVAAEPFDIEEAPVPTAWKAELDDGRALVGVINWSDEPAWVHVDEYLSPGEIAFDVFRGQLLGKGDVALEPGDATLWQVVAPGKGPRVVGDAASLSFSHLYQRPVSGRVQVGNDLDVPRTVAIEARRQVFEVLLSPGERRWFD